MRYFCIYFRKENALLRLFSSRKAYAAWRESERDTRGHKFKELSQKDAFVLSSEYYSEILKEGGEIEKS